MEKVLILDTGFASFNKGDEIIMECVRKELTFLLDKRFELSLPTHVSPFHWYQVWRNSLALQEYANCTYKFVGGSNILIPNLLTHFPQWNINLFNYQPMKGAILVGVGAGANAENGCNLYTRYLYSKLLNKEYYHSARDERSKKFMEQLGVKAINTGCPTMWILTPDFCKEIPTTKSSKVIFTITRSVHLNKVGYQLLIDTLTKNYQEIYFWPQCLGDYEYFQSLSHIEHIHILPATKNAYDDYLTNNETDYIGTRLHGGIYAMRHKRRSIIIAIDERARAINEKNHLPCIEWNNLNQLNDMINSSIETRITIDNDAINQWKQQFN